jgi:hypothetical protein
MTDSKDSAMKPPSSNGGHPRSLVGHRARIAALLFSVAAAIGVGVALAPASAQQSNAGAVEASFVQQGADDDPGRAEFRKDLKDVRGLEGQERRDALKKLRDDARDGKYGDRIDQRFERRGDHHAAFFALLPDQLQANLKKARAIDDADDRRAALQDIRKKALAGDYGDKVKEAWKLLGEHRPGPGHEPA